MQDYPRTSLPAQPYDNRIYTRKYDPEPRVNDQYQSGYMDYSQQRGINSGYPSSTQQRPYFQPMSQRAASFGQPLPQFVSGFKSTSREDDLLRKLDMYEQKYQMGTIGKPSTTATTTTATRRPFESVQLGQQLSQQQMPPPPRGREYNYSCNQSPAREGRERQQMMAQQEPYARDNSRYPPAAQRYNMESEARGGELRQSLGMRSSYEDLNRSFEVPGRSTGYQPRQQQQQPRQRIQYDVGPPPPSRNAYQPQSRYNNNNEELQNRDPLPSQNPRFDQKSTSDLRFDPRSQRPLFEAAPTPKSRGLSLKPQPQPRGSQTREFRQRGGVYDYRQTTHSRETRQMIASRNRFPVCEEPIRTVENQQQQPQPQGREQREPREPREQRESIRAPLGQLSYDNNEKEDTEKAEKKNGRFRGEVDVDTREDRLRDIRRKASKDQTTSNSSFHLERSEKKQSLKERSQQLRQRLNEPSPLKQRLSNLSQTKQGKQNSQYQSNRYNKRLPPTPTDNNSKSSTFPPQPNSVSFIQNQPIETPIPQDLKARRLSFNTEQTDRQLTPSKAKPEMEEDTYRKIETINDLNNKINERIRHILSTFSQEPAC